jgi:hypothetical protein
LVLVSIVDRELEFALFGPENDGLSLHAADHVEGSLGLPAQGHLQHVVLDARLDGLAQLGGDLKVAVRRTQAFDALVGPLVVVVLDPEPDPFPGRLEALKLSAGEELAPDRFPEALDLAQGHGMVRPGFDMMGPVLLHLGLEAGGPAPVDELSPVVGQHLLGRLELPGRHPENLQHILGGVAAEEVRADQEPGVIVHEADQVGIPAAQPEGEDVRLPHLVGRGPLEKAGPGEVAPRPGRALYQPLFAERSSDRLRTGRQEKHPP